MDGRTLNSSNLIIYLGLQVVFLTAMSRFNKPQVLLKKSSSQSFKWIEYIKQSLCWNPGVQNSLLIPPRARKKGDGSIYSK
jgi:hypothetical protein